METKNFYRVVASSLLVLMFFGFSAPVYAGARGAFPITLSQNFTNNQIPKIYQRAPRGAINKVIFSKASLLDSQTGDVVTFETPGGQVEVIFDSLIKHNDGVITWIGHSAKYGKAFKTIISMSSTVVTGSIQIDGDLYDIKTDANTKNVWMLDMSIAQFAVKAPVLSEEPIILENGSTAIPTPAMEAIPVTPIFNIQLPPFFRQKTKGLITWKVPEGFNEKLRIKFYFSTDGVNYKLIKKPPLSKEATYWKPGKKKITDNGSMVVCAKPQKGKTVEPVCELITGIKVIAKDAEDPISIPATPTGLTGTGTSVNTIHLSWNAPADTVDGVKVYRDNNLIKTLGRVAEYQDTVPALSTHTYAISLFNSAGESPKSAPITAKTLPDTIKPSTPAITQATSVSLSEVLISWSVATDNVAVKSYELFRDGARISTFSSSITTVKDINLAYPATYTYQVRAVDTSGNIGALSAPVDVVTGLGGIDTTPPTPPGNLHVTDLGMNFFRIEWSPSTDDTGVNGYYIYVNGVEYAPYAIQVFSHIHYGYSPNSTYNVRVVAEDYLGNKSSAATLAIQTKPATTTSEIGLIVYYQKDLVGGLTEVHNQIDLINQAMIDSGTKITVKAVQIIPVDYPASNTVSTALSHLISEEGVFSQTRNLRIAYNGDFVMFIRPLNMQDLYCGIALPNYDIHLNPLIVESVSGLDPQFCYRVPPHELGHTLGLAHDIITDPNPSTPRKYARGFSLPDKSLGDIMSYAFWNAVGMYSSPNIIINGIPLGVPVGQPEEADGVKALNEWRLELEESDLMLKAIVKL